MEAPPHHQHVREGFDPPSAGGSGRENQPFDGQADHADEGDEHHGFDRMLEELPDRGLGVLASCAVDAAGEQLGNSLAVV